MSCSTPAIIGGPFSWSGTRDKDGHREYRIKHKVRVSDTASSEEGPATVLLSTPGIPLPGSTWSFDGDDDLSAICQWDATVKKLVDSDERTKFYEIEQVFSTRPNNLCIGVGGGTGTAYWNPASDPLNAPPKISGGFTKYTEEKTFNVLGDPFTNSSHERLRGSLVEFDSNRATIRIQINEATLGLPIKLALIDTLNHDTLWGFGAGRVKLSNITWQQLFSGNCTCYYETTYEFECNEDGFDRSIVDEGTKALNGKWNTTTGAWELVNINGSPPNKNNPSHFIRITDLLGNPMRATLNGNGVPATNLSGTGSGVAGEIVIAYYDVTDFLSSIPSLPSTIEC